jgi:hypothetical protein
VGDITPALVAIASIIGGLVALARTIPRVRRFFRVDQAELVANLRSLADTWEQKYNLERAAHEVTRGELVFERSSGRQCREELDDLRSTVRQRKRAGGVT